MRLLPGVRLVDRPGVLHLFDGRRVVSLKGDERVGAAVRRAVAGRTDPSDQAARDAQELLQRLQLADGDDGPADISSAAAFASASVAGWVSPAAAERRLAAVRVHVWDESGPDLLAALERAGLRCTPLAGLSGVERLDPQRSVLAVQLPDDRAAERLLAVNRTCLAHGITWLPLGGFDGAVLRVGPLMIPGQSACAECLLRRLAANVEYAELYRDIADAPAAPAPKALRDWSRAMAALVLLRWVADQDAAIPGRLFTLVPDELNVRQASVFRVPRCPVCAAPDHVLAAAPWELARDH